MRVGRRRAFYSGIAQLVEHLTVNQAVDGSSPPAGVIMESCPSGLRSTIGNRVCAKSVPGVRIPISPPGKFKVVLMSDLFTLWAVFMQGG